MRLSSWRAAGGGRASFAFPSRLACTKEWYANRMLNGRESQEGGKRQGTAPALRAAELLLASLAFPTIGRRNSLEVVRRLVASLSPYT